MRTRNLFRRQVHSAHAAIPEDALETSIATTDNTEEEGQEAEEGKQEVIGPSHAARVTEVSKSMFS